MCMFLRTALYRQLVCGGKETWPLYIQIKTWLVKAEIARKAHEVTKPGRMEPF